MAVRSLPFLSAHRRTCYALTIHFLCIFGYGDCIGIAPFAQLIVITLPVRSHLTVWPPGSDIVPSA